MSTDPLSTPNGAWSQSAGGEILAGDLRLRATVWIDAMLGIVRSTRPIPDEGGPAIQW
jgi:hypothetical protein